jgi:hypothetical protein
MTQIFVLARQKYKQQIVSYRAAVSTFLRGNVFLWTNFSHIALQ